jgi:hypothetical protein
MSQRVFEWGDWQALLDAHLLDDRPVQLTVVEEGILIHPARQLLSLAERLARYQPMESDVSEMMAWEPIGAEGVK